jgi:hypothetical protein
VPTSSSALEIAMHLPYARCFPPLPHHLHDSSSFALKIAVFAIICTEIGGEMSPAAHAKAFGGECTFGVLSLCVCSTSLAPESMVSYGRLVAIVGRIERIACYKVSLMAVIMKEMKAFCFYGMNRVQYRWSVERCRSDIGSTGPHRMIR